MASLADIQQFRVLYTGYFNEQKFKEAAYLYTEDGVLMPPEVPMLKGRKGKRKSILCKHTMIERLFIILCVNWIFSLEEGF